MKNKVLKVAIIVLLIMIMTMSDFILVGINIAHAIESTDNSTNHDNVKFIAYFKTEDGKQTSKSEYAIDNAQMKLYMQVSVKNEGYFDGVVTLEDSNFKLKQDILGENISKIEENKITLNRVRAGNTVEIEVGIEPIITESYGANMLSAKSLLQLTGQYKDSTEKSINISAEKEVALTLTTPSNLETQLEAEVITNRIYKIGEENKKIVQIELNSTVVENAYPVKSTTYEVSIPEGAEKVEVISKGTYATNGEADRVLKNYTVENNTLKITIENEIKDGKISWKKDATDNLIITLMLDEKAQIEEEYTAKSKVEFKGTEGKIIEKDLTYELDKEADGLIRASIENSEIIYKGKIYSKEEREYSTTTNLEINYANLVEGSSFIEKTEYKTETEFKSANIEYKTTTIAKAEVEKILGQGKLIIKDQNGNVIQEVTKDTPATDGNVVITYPAGVKQLIIETTKGISTGIIRLNHVKVIKVEGYKAEEIKELKQLVEQVKVDYNNAEYQFDKIKTLGETKTVAEVTIDKQTLSTATVNEQVKIAITLKTDSEQYDLYQDPTIKIKLPDSVKNVELTKATPLYLENMNISSAKYLQETKEIELKLNGNQTKYNGINTNMYIEILANIELEETTPNKEDEIRVTYTNNKAIAYENEGKIPIPVNIYGYSGLVAFNNIKNYGVKTNSVSSTEQVGNLKMYQDATEANYQIALLNNTGNDLNNVRVLGNLPVEGNITVGEHNFENTVAATLKSQIEVQNGQATIYYTANKNATTDLSVTENGWNANLAEVTNPVLYLILITNMAKETNFIANYTMNIPANLEHGKDMKSTYMVNYMAGASDATVNAVPVKLETGKIAVTLEATVGTDKLEDGMTVKAGEVIKYKATVTNTGSIDAKNVVVKGLVPEGTVYVEPLKSIEDGEGELTEVGFEHAGEVYYEEIDTATVETTLKDLPSGGTKILEYEVRVKNEITQGKAENKVIVTYNDNIETQSNTLTHKLEAGDIRVTVKRVAHLENLTPGAVGQYYVIVENISKTEQKDIKIKFNMPSEEITTLKHIEELQIEVLKTKNEWNIDSIASGEYKIYSLFLELNKIDESIVQAQLNAIATQNGNTYRSNVYNEEFYGFDINVNMSSPNAGEYVKTDDVIEYDIEIHNKSQVEVSLMLVDEIPEELSIQKIEIDGNVIGENVLDHSLYKILDFKANSKMTIKISTIVNYNPTRLENVTINNIAKVLYAGEELASSEEIKHIIESIVIKDEENPDKPVDPENPENPDNPGQPSDPDNPENPDNPGQPSDPDNPVNPNDPTNPEKPTVTKKKYNISGKAWVDQDKDGEMNNEDQVLKGIKVKLLNVETNQFVRNEENKKDLIIETSEDGYYEFKNIEEGKYIVVFEYDNTLYKPTIYQKEGILENKNSNVVSKKLTINGELKEYATTNEIELKQNIANINMGLVFVKQFDVKLEKFVSKVIVQTSKDTTTYNYENEDFAKVDINAKRMVGSTILVQYTIKVTNIGDVDAYVNSIVDYLPAGFKFSSELNKEWYQNEADLYTSCLESKAIAPGESQEVNLVLTKTKTDGNAELINNMAEVHDAYNIYGILDTNSEVGNKNKEENDFGSADLMISIQTGTVFNYIALVISMLGIIGVAAYLINKKIFGIKI